MNSDRRRRELADFLQSRRKLAKPSLLTKAAEESAPPALQAILDRMGTYPAYVIDKR